MRWGCHRFGESESIICDIGKSCNGICKRVGFGAFLKVGVRVKLSVIEYR